MTRLLFEEFVYWFDERMNGKKILLLVDNCPAHPKVIEGLSNVELFFLPPNTTTNIQPCDVGIISKSIIDVVFFSSVLKGYKIGATNPEKINVLNAINFINAAWNIGVKNTTNANCFQHCKIRLDEGVATEQQVGEDEGIHGLHKAIFGPTEMPWILSIY